VDMRSLLGSGNCPFFVLAEEKRAIVAS